jgi:hypothetical protein
MARAERDGAPKVWAENLSLLFSHSMKLQREAASCGCDDFREISGGKPMKNRYRRAW